ncbi:MAG: phosphoribosyl-ATP diphosphatase [Chloroflexi bacterium]|nr:phosphoribosyl-ATP diphosphatase [Chloroflexota bacterium]MCY3581609.1 phosphoribosyl-ATP diphosphatase [Chloroflexota bacterium]MCY3716092.1 phosphoribosyl-ATP diphosphatase [Chloroflexota bacterium]MDE2651413.1 phosphoribosyl-ATP diphosphatase [Chloroflexota bacterium]
MDMLDQLEAIIHDRQRNPQAGSYTNRLLESGLPAIAQKVGEEAVEVAIAALAQDKNAQVDEFADLLYHSLVLMRALDINLHEVRARLQQRHQPPG